MENFVLFIIVFGLNFINLDGKKNKNKNMTLRQMKQKMGSIITLICIFRYTHKSSKITV